MRGPDAIHAGAWWLWALCLAGAASQTTNPLLLLLILAVAGLVVATCRQETSFGRGFRIYLWLAGVVVAVRILFRIFLGGDFGTSQLFALAVLELPEWMGSFEVGGPVTLEEILAGAYDGLRLATILVCVGAANTLADPRRLLGVLPRALSHVASTVVVALTVAPQLIEVIGRVRRARSLRGEQTGGLGGLRSLVVPVLEDTVSRSLSLAASMETRGYGHIAPAPGSIGAGLASLGLVGTGTFALLTSPRWGGIGAAAAAVGVAGSMWTIRHIGSRVSRSRYRPEPWHGNAWVVTGAGLAALVAVSVVGLMDPSILSPPVEPPSIPVLAPVATVGIVLAAFPLVLNEPRRVLTSLPGEASA